VCVPQAGGGSILDLVSFDRISYCVFLRVIAVTTVVESEDGPILSKPGFEFRDALAFGVEFTLFAAVELETNHIIHVSVAPSRYYSTTRRFRQKSPRCAGERRRAW